jgi:hypothetical protein
LTGPPRASGSTSSSAASTLARLIRYRPGGKGVIRVEAFEPSVDGWKLDAVAHRTLEGMEKLLLKSANGPTN